MGAHMTMDYLSGIGHGKNPGSFEDTVFEINKQNIHKIPFQNYLKKILKIL